MQLLYGKPIADKILNRLKDDILANDKKPGLAVISVGDNQASQLYVSLKEKKAQEIGQTVGSYQFLTNPEATPPQQAAELNNTKLVKYDFAWAGQNRSALVEKWNKAIKA